MRKGILVRKLTPGEETELYKRSTSRTLAKRDVERAKIILLRAKGSKAKDIAEQLGCNTDKVTTWVKRFNEEGLDGLTERAGRGRPAIYSEVQRGQMIALARTQPSELGEAYGYWSLRRLAVYLAQMYDIQISKSQLGQILEQEGLRWYQERSYFTERPDPDFAEKRGPL